MNNNISEKIVDVEIEHAIADTGNRGPQWKLPEAMIRTLSKFPSTYWIDRKDGDSPPAPGTYRSRIVRGRLKDGKTGQYDNHYRWYIQDFGLDPNVVSARDVPTPTPTQAWQNADHTTSGSIRTSWQPAPVGTPPIDVTRNSIERQVVFKAAVDIFVANWIKRGDGYDPVAADIQALTERLWPVLKGIGVDEAATEDGPATTQWTAGERDYRDTATTFKWTGTQVKKWLGMTYADWVAQGKNEFEQEARRKSALESCMAAYNFEQEARRNAENTPSEDQLDRPTRVENDSDLPTSLPFRTARELSRQTPERPEPEVETEPKQDELPW